MSTSYTLMPVADDHFEAVFGLHEELFRPHIEQLWGWDEDWQRQNFANNWRDCETKLIVGEDRIIGYLQTVVRADHLLLKNLGLLPAHQNLGIGVRVMESLKNRSAEMVLPLRLSVFVTNPDALRFYQRQGLVHFEIDEQFHHLIWHPETSSIPG